MQSLCTVPQTLGVSQENGTTHELEMATRRSSVTSTALVHTYVGRLKVAWRYSVFLVYFGV